MNDYYKRVPDPRQERMTKNIEENGPSGLPKEAGLGKFSLDDLITRHIDPTKPKS